MVLSREEKQKMVLDLYYNKGYTYKQLTKELGMSPNQIREIIKRHEEKNDAIANNNKKDIVLLELEKQKSEQIGSQVRILAKLSEDYKQQIDELHRRKIALESLIREFENNEAYKKIRRTAEEEVNNALLKGKDTSRFFGYRRSNTRSCQIQFLN